MTRDEIDQLKLTAYLMSSDDDDGVTHLPSWRTDIYTNLFKQADKLEVPNGHKFVRAEGSLSIRPMDKSLVNHPANEKQGLSRVTSLELSCSRLWIGTGTGSIISIPLTIESMQDTSRAVDIPGKDKPPGGAVRVYTDVQTDRVAPASYVPYCDISQAQLSYHGHRDCLRFFSTIAGNSKETSLFMSGGEGYVDFRVGDEEPTDQVDETSPAYWSHLIVWEVSNQHSTS